MGCSAGIFRAPVILYDESSFVNPKYDAQQEWKRPSKVPGREGVNEAKRGHRSTNKKDNKIPAHLVVPVSCCLAFPGL